MLKAVSHVVSLLFLSLFLTSWGTVGHKTINSKCPDSFPASMNSFKIWADSLGSNASNADNRKSSDNTESPKHFIDIDSYPEFNSTGRIPSTYDSIVSIHGSGYVINIGTLPWATLNMYDTLKVDFQKRKWHKAMLDASDLGHYVGDGHMPLHLATNYDGQLTGQKGIHSRYETSMVGTYTSSLNTYSGTQVQFVSNVNKYIFDYIYFDHQYEDSVLVADSYAKNLTGSTISTEYYTALWSKAHFTTMLFKNASHALAELIYSAWVEAGSPAFGSKAITGISNTPVNNISVYPNPCRGILSLIGDDIFKTEISSAAGIKMGLYYSKSINLCHLSNGIYILSIFGKEGLLKKEKVMILK